MKTRIIQTEPVPSALTQATAPVAAGRETWLRRGLLAVAVLGYVVLGVVHPLEIEVGDGTTLYLWIHLVQPVLILFLAWGIWLLVRDRAGTAATVARVAIVPYAIVYAMFDAIAGVGLGQVIREANDAGGADAAVVQRLLVDGSGIDWIGNGIWIGAGLTWFVMAFAAAVAVKDVGGLGPTLLMSVGAAIFAIAHPFPPGPIGITLFGLGVAWLEVRRDAARAPAAKAALAP
jgi:hypothetical protein